MTRTWRLLGPDGFYESAEPGTLGGHRRFRRSEIERLLREANAASTNQY